MRLGNMAKVQGGYAFKSTEFINAGTPIIRIGNLDGEKVIVDKEICYPEIFWEEHPEFRINNGDILITMSGATVGKVGVYGLSEKALLNQRVGNILPKRNILKSYIYYYCLSPVFRRNIEENAFGCAQPNISAKQIEEFNINVPSISEQEKAIEVLGKTLNIVRNRKKQLEDLDNLIKSRFVEMFGDPIINPMGWVVKQLGTFVEFMTSGSRGWSGYFADEGEMFLTIKNVKNCSISTENMQYVHAPLTKEAERTRVKEGDLLISITADLGRTGVVNADIAGHGAYINQHLSLVRLDMEHLNPLFVSQYLETEAGKKQFESKNQVGVKSGLNFEAIRSLSIIVPPKESQVKYVDFVAQVDKLKVEVQKSLKEAQLLFDSLMQKYFG